MTRRKKQRERVQKRLGKLDIDYPQLYDGFFRRQTKWRLTPYGDFYDEGIRRYCSHTAPLDVPLA
jgi:splicing factor 3B subunit 2